MEFVPLFIFCKFKLIRRLSEDYPRKVGKHCIVCFSLGIYSKLVAREARAVINVLLYYI